MSLRLSEDFYDFATGLQHCPRCKIAVATRHTTLVAHYAAEWHHMAKVDFVGIRAKDELGKTIEEGWLHPPRTILTQVPTQTNLAYCTQCAPFIHAENCTHCGNPVDKETDHTKVRTLLKQPDNTNTDLREYWFHIHCLPKEFDLS